MTATASPTALPPAGEIVLYDLEYTSWPGCVPHGWDADKGQHREVVQIGAVRLDLGRDCAEVGALDCLVVPRINPTLSAYFIALTGLTQADLEQRGVAFATALERFRRFCSGAEGAYSHGPDGDVLEENGRLTGVDLPFEPGFLRDLKPALQKVIGYAASVTSCEVPALLGLTSEGRAHDALADARGLSEAVRALRREQRL